MLWLPGGAVTVNDVPLALGSHEEYPEGCSVTYQPKSNDLVTASSEVVTIETPQMKFTAWAPRALTTEDPTEVQASTASYRTNSTHRGS